jgi:hypothetical protein
MSVPWRAAIVCRRFGESREGKHGANGSVLPRTGSGHWTTGGDSMLKEGDKAPDVTGVSYDGASFDLGAPGRRTVLFFYPKANTGG